MVSDRNRSIVVAQAAGNFNKSTVGTFSQATCQKDRIAQCHVLRPVKRTGFQHFAVNGLYRVCSFRSKWVFYQHFIIGLQQYVLFAAANIFHIKGYGRGCAVSIVAGDQPPAFKCFGE